MRIQSPEQKYMDEVFGLDCADLALIREELAKQGVENMSVAANEARILQFFIRGFGVKRIVEFGTLFGYSAIAMAQALPADGVIMTLEKNPANFELAQKNFASLAVGKKVKALCGDATETMPAAAQYGPFDMAFIDANKGGYVDYLNWAEANVRQGGLIIGDNTFLFGALWNESRGREIGAGQVRVMKEFNSRLADPAKYNSIMVPTHEGMTVAQKLF